MITIARIKNFVPKIVFLRYLKKILLLYYKFYDRAPARKVRVETHDVEVVAC